jgi:NAD(P)-dependent dehydrogenase (short-subunit alcohol dehydrogenase family)
MTQPALLIVGGTHGIGKEVARRYAGQDWSVVLTSRDDSTAKSVATELGGDTHGIALDLSEPELVAGALADVDAVDHVVLAAIARDTNTLDNYDIESARYLVIMKLLGYTAVVSAMRDRLAEDGSIVLFGGRAKDRPYRGGMTVGTVNAGISGMVPTLTLLVAPRRVNAIHPGLVTDTPYWSGRHEFIEQVRLATPTGRNVPTEDVVDAVDFLIRNRSVNGIDLYIDGGWLVPSMAPGTRPMP